MTVEQPGLHRLEISSTAASIERAQAIVRHMTPPVSTVVETELHREVDA